MIRLSPAIVCAALLMGGCAFVPQANYRLEEARRAHASALAEPRIAQLAPAQWARANEALGNAIAAWETLQDSAVVDHLAYVASQRIEIARETARRVAAEARMAGADRARAEGGAARP